MKMNRPGRLRSFFEQFERNYYRKILFDCHLLENSKVIYFVA